MSKAEDQLFGVSPEEYGEDYQSVFLSMYNDYVGSADNISERRQKANSFFLSVNTALLGATSFLTGDEKNLMWLVAIVGVFLCVAWRQLIASYRTLNGAKMRVILLLEKRLPFAAYGTEWEMLEHGENSKVHIPFSRIESLVPVVFMAMYAVICWWSFRNWI